MRLAYLVLAHKHPEQIERTVRALHSPRNLYLVHIDRKSPPAVHRAAARLRERFANVRVMPSGDVCWGGYSQVDLTLRGIRFALSSAGWDFFVNVSGQDFPLVPQDHIAQALRPLQGRNLIQVLDVRRDRPWYMKRFSRYTIEAFGGARVLPRLPRLPPPRDLTLHAGSQWFILSRATCEYFARWEDPLLHRLQKLHRHSSCPDELFFHTALMNGPLRDTVVNDNKRFILWAEPSAHPLSLTDRHFDAMIESGAFFARKFEPDEPVLARLERRIGVPEHGS